MDKDRELLQKEIEELNEQIRKLAYNLGGLLDVDCAMGVCTFNPEADDLQEKMAEVEEKKQGISTKANVGLIWSFAWMRLSARILSRYAAFISPFREANRCRSKSWRMSIT